MTLSTRAPPQDPSTSRANKFPSLRENPLLEPSWSFGRLSPAMGKPAKETHPQIILLFNQSHVGEPIPETQM